MKLFRKNHLPSGPVSPEVFDGLLRRPFKRLHYAYVHYSYPEEPPRRYEVVSDTRLVKKTRWKTNLFLSRIFGETSVQYSENARKKQITIHSIIFDSNLRNSESMRRVENLVKMLETRARATSFTSIVTDRTIINPKLAKKLGYFLVKQMRSASVEGAGKRPTYKYSKAIPQTQV